MIESAIQKKSNLLIACLLASPFLILVLFSWEFAISYLLFILFLEIFFYITIHHLKKKFQWLITPEDRYPFFEKDALKKFLCHGYDPHLGWIRKPGTTKEEISKSGNSTYHIDSKGARSNPGHAALPADVLCFGDSFTFCRQVNDNETFEWFLSEKTQTNIINFGVGNYGLDQALLRLARECPKYKAKVVVMGVVPSTIVRILSVWKHYNEYGNIFGFKPRFFLKDGKLELQRNIIDEEDKFLQYKNFLPLINQNDPFYRDKFEKDMLRFPYLVSILSNPFRNIPILAMTAWDQLSLKCHGLKPYPSAMKTIMKSNLQLRVDLFRKNKEARELLERLVMEFVQYGKQFNFTPVFMWMPQKDDVLFIREKKSNYYSEFISGIQNKVLTIDLTEYLLDHRKIDSLYSDQTQYGGHFRCKGNKLIAEILYKTLIKDGLLQHDG